jgi:ribonucleoside-diphosphate reductase alpha chain
LDNVLDVNRFALEDNRVMSMRLRRLGLGVMGLADALIKMGYAYDSDAGRAAVQSMIETLHEAAVGASERLAEERGAFPGIVDADLATPRRNVAVLTVAPTGTTSMLMGVSSGVEPVFAPFIYRKIGDSYAALIHPLFQELLERHEAPPALRKGDGWNWDAVVEAVQKAHGSVQPLPFVPEAVKRVMVCAHDIRPNDHVRMQGVVQRAFDGGAQAANSISKTINLPNGATVDDVFGAYALAFDEGCKGITVYRDGSRQFQVLSTSVQSEDDAGDEEDGRDETPSAAASPAAQGVAASSAPTGGAATSGADTSSAPAVAVVTAPLPPVNGPSLGLAASATGATLPGEPLFDRPTRLEGFTDAGKWTLPTGEQRGFYVTVNKQDGLPSEVFILSGKAGDEANADSEALGRVVSIALQYGVPAEALVKTLRGINGGMYGTYQGRMVASKADMIAVALETSGVQNVLAKGKGCPECGLPLRYEEGCMKCEGCGYSKCG